VLTVNFDIDQKSI